MATGGLSAPHRPDWPGIDSFAGAIVQTSLWPEEGVELEGKRIGIVGTGSSGVQAIPELAKVAGHLTVFQRTATFTWPSQNKPLTAEEQAAVKAHYREVRDEQYASPLATAGTTGRGDLRGPHRRPEDQGEHARGARGRARRARVQRRPASGPTPPRTSTPTRWRSSCSARWCAAPSHDPETADSLCPKDYPHRLQAPGARRRLLRDVQPRQRVARRPPQGPGRRGRPRAASAPSAASSSSTCSCFATGFDAMTGALDPHRRPRRRRAPPARRLGRRARGPTWASRWPATRTCS